MTILRLPAMGARPLRPALPTATVVIALVAIHAWPPFSKPKLVPNGRVRNRELSSLLRVTETLFSATADPRRMPSSLPPWRWRSTGGEASTRGPGAPPGAQGDVAGMITTVAGSGEPRHSGDGGSATNASFRTPTSVAVDSSGTYTLQPCAPGAQVDAAGVITTVAGTGEPGHSGDGGPAASAQLL